MIKAIEFPNKSFSTKEDLFFELKKNEDRLISLKTSEVYKSHEKGQFSFLNFDKCEDVDKGLYGAKANHIYPIISTTNYMDSHKDVHFNGSMTKTAKEQNGKVVYALDHELKFDSIIAWQKDVNMFVRQIDWSLVGKDYVGKTEALIFEISKDKITRKDVLTAIENKVSEFQNSIRMVYVKMILGMNSKDKEHASNKAYYDSRINQIANKEVAEDEGYFWGVEELKIYKEGSLVVAGGSNDATSIYNKEIEAVDNTSKQKQEPSIDTRKNKIKYLTDNFKL
jgi:hypothetical protein